MTVKDFYDGINGNYEEIIKRLGNDDIVVQFLEMFISDKSFEKLIKAANECNIESSFKSAHALKGVAGNLAFTQLYDSASALTEQLRPRVDQADPDLLEKVREDYIDTVNMIKEVLR